jgi:hypothetical protein
VFERVLARMRSKVRTRNYVMTLHAEEEMNADEYTIYDVERGILTGTILERQRDASTSERKYCVAGRAVAGEPIELVAKFGPTGSLVIITVYRP